MARAARSGSLEAFDQLMLATQAPLRAWLSYRARSLEMADEILQRTYVAAYEGLANWREDGDVRWWLRGIAHNQLRMELREQVRCHAASQDELEHTLLGIQERALEDVPTTEPDASMQRLRDCLERLDDRQRRLLESRYREDLPIKELARRFKRKADAIKQVLFRLRGALRRCMEESR